MRCMDGFLSSHGTAFASFLNDVSSLPANLPPPLPSFEALDNQVKRC